MDYLPVVALTLSTWLYIKIFYFLSRIGTLIVVPIARMTTSVELRVDQVPPTDSALLSINDEPIKHTRLPGVPSV
jgi:hypothetical protein